jgi:hypothetical protein
MRNIAFFSVMIFLLGSSFTTSLTTLPSEQNKDKPYYDLEVVGGVEGLTPEMIAPYFQEGIISIKAENVGLNKIKLYKYTAQQVAAMTEPPPCQGTPGNCSAYSWETGCGCQCRTCYYMSANTVWFCKECLPCPYC